VRVHYGFKLWKALQEEQQRRLARTPCPKYRPAHRDRLTTLDTTCDVIQLRSWSRLGGVKKRAQGPAAVVVLVYQCTMHKQSGDDREIVRERRVSVYEEAPGRVTGYDPISIWEIDMGDRYGRSDINEKSI